MFKQVQGEVPGSPIFIMKVASQVRALCTPKILKSQICPSINLLLFICDMFSTVRVIVKYIPYLKHLTSIFPLLIENYCI